jgi:hypothetical protein
MKETIVKRRELLRWMTFSSPMLYLGGCGGGLGNGAPTPEATPIFTIPLSSQVASSPLLVASGVANPLVTLYAYSGQSLTPTITDLAAALYNLTSTNDRFDDGNLCYAFNGTSSLAVVQSVSGVLSGRFAISFWAKSANSAHTQAVAIAAGAKAVAAIEFNYQYGLGVYWGNFDSYRLGAGTPGQFTDDGWHHFLVEFDGTSLSAFVDGIAMGSVAAPSLGGAGDLYIGGSAGLRWNGAIDDVRLYDRVFDAAYIPQMVYAWTQVKPATRNDSLLAYYPFDGNAVNDTGRGFNGTLFNVTPTTDRFGAAARAYAFNGSDSYIELPTQLGPAQDFCLAFWFLSSGYTEMTAYSVTKGITPGAADLNVVFNAGSALSVKLDGGTSSAISVGAPGDLSDGAWHFLFLQCTGATFQLYVDSALKGTMQNGSPVLTSDSIIRFGRASGTSLVAENFWSGSLDDAQIYLIQAAAPFTPQDIAALMQLQFRPHDGAGALVFQNKVWYLGGWNPADALPTTDQVWSSSDGSNWSFICDAPWERRHMAGWLVYNNRLWVIGGDNLTGHYQNDVWSSADGLNWVEETTSVPWAGRATQYTVVFNDLMWLMGGQQINSASDGGADTTPGTAYNDVYSSADGKSWNLVTQNAGWSPRGLIIGNVVFAGKMWVIGGGQYDLRTYLNDVWNSADGINWAQVTASAPWAGRQFHNIAVFDNKIWVVAGGTAQAEGGSIDVWYSTDGHGWTRLAGTPWVPRHAASVFVFQNALWIGNGSDSAVYNDVWKMTYAT